MREDKSVLFICSENPILIKNGISAALNTGLRSLQSVFRSVDIYIHKSEKIIVSSTNNEFEIRFKEIILQEYDYIFLSPVNIAYQYLLLYRNIRKNQVYCFLSDTYSYTLFRLFTLGIKFNTYHFKMLIKLPVIYFLEKYVELYSRKVFLQTEFDVRIFNKIFCSKKGIEFSNSPVFRNIEISDIIERKGMGWIATFTDDYYSLSKWFFKNVLYKVFDRNPNFVLHIHGQNSHKMKSFIDNQFPENCFQIIYTEYLNDLSELYLKTKIILSPVYKGFGIINKTIEGMYYGCIVIGDPASFNGIRGAKDGINCHIAKSAKEFVEKIENTYNGSIELRQVSRKANSIIKHEFSINNNINTLREVLKI